MEYCPFIRRTAEGMMTECLREKCALFGKVSKRCSFFRDTIYPPFYPRIVDPHDHSDEVHVNQPVYPNQTWVSRSETKTYTSVDE